MPTPNITTLPASKTPIAELSAGSHAAITAELLSDEACRLPCFFAVYPGQSTSFALPALADLGIVTAAFVDGRGRQARQGSFDFYDEGLYQSIRLVEENDTVTGLRLWAESRNQSARLKSVWRQYAPEAIVERYGPPTRILIQALEGIRGLSYASVPYAIWLYYDDLKVALNYVGTTPTAPTYTICPTFRAPGTLGFSLAIYTLPADSSQSLDEYIGNETGYPPTRWPVQDVTGLSIAEFTERLASEQGDPCIETQIRMAPQAAGLR